MLRVAGYLRAQAEFLLFAVSLQTREGLLYRSALRKACVMNPGYAKDYTGHEFRIDSMRS